MSSGYAHCPGVFPPEEIEGYLDLARRVLRLQEDDDYRARHRSIGSLFDLLEEPGFVELITSGSLLAALRSLGCRDPRFEHGIVFNKLPGTPRTFWHQDGTTWGHASSYAPEPTELIAIVYLGETTPSNGCLRVIPGSHRYRHALHDALATRSTAVLRRAESLEDAAYATFPEEVDVPVATGDLVVLDARLLHAAHANASDRPRTALSLWYIPDPLALPDRVRARFTWAHGPNDRLPYIPAGWPVPAAARLASILPPRYAGSTPPLPMLNRPGKELR